MTTKADPRMFPQAFFKKESPTTFVVGLTNTLKRMIKPLLSLS